MQGVYCALWSTESQSRTYSPDSSLSFCRRCPRRAGPAPTSPSQSQLHPVLQHRPFVECQPAQLVRSAPGFLSPIEQAGQVFRHPIGRHQAGQQLFGGRRRVRCTEQSLLHQGRPLSRDHRSKRRGTCDYGSVSRLWYPEPLRAIVLLQLSQQLVFVGRCSQQMQHATQRRISLFDHAQQYTSLSL